MPDGRQVYDVPPWALSIMARPAQMACVESSVITGLAFTFMVTFSVSVQPRVSVPITVYIVVLVGFANVLSQVAQVIVPDGVHE